jgi:hypothetical protein
MSQTQQRPPQRRQRSCPVDWVLTVRRHCLRELGHEPPHDYRTTAVEHTRATGHVTLIYATAGGKAVDWRCQDGGPQCRARRSGKS